MLRFIFCLVLGLSASVAYAETATISVSNLPAKTSVRIYIGDGKTYSMTVTSDEKGNASATFTVSEIPENGSAKWTAHAEYGKTPTRQSNSRWSVQGKKASTSIKF